MAVEDLLDKKWYGGLYHLHNTSDTWENWVEEFEPFYQYPTNFKEKAEKIFQDNLVHIQNKNVVDLGCNLGYFSLLASNVGAKSVLGIEVRQPYIDTFNYVYNYWPTKNITLKSDNLEILDRYQDWLTNIDTILYIGHFYHTSQHNPILESFTKSSATCLILESVDPGEETITHAESTADILNGYLDENTDFIEVSSPSITETTRMLIDLGWTIKQTSYINCSPKRFVITAIKDTREYTPV